MTLLRWSGIALVAASWLSAAIFGAYIVAFYLGAFSGQHLSRWNDNLPGLYAPHIPVALAAMSAHLATGSVILLLGPIQLMPASAGAGRCVIAGAAVSTW